MKRGFTLAEVLITLGIIGIVAAMTLPAVINTYKKQELVARLKKSYTVLNQAMKLAEVDHGEFEYWETPQQIGKEAYTQKYFKQYFNIMKECKDADDCGYSRIQYRALDGKTYRYGTVWAPNGTTIAVADGSIYQFRTSVQADDLDDPSLTDKYSSLIFIDTNGSKEPNTLGKDVFIFKRQDGILKPFGQELTYDEIDSNCKTDGTGEYCAAKIIADGWQLKNYPGL